jgi:hypothetical protein
VGTSKERDFPVQIAKEMLKAGRVSVNGQYYQSYFFAITIGTEPFTNELNSSR